MLSTGREYDRLFMMLIVIALVTLLVYIHHVYSRLEKKQKTYNGHFDERINDLCTQMSDAQTYIQSNKQEVQEQTKETDKTSTNVGSLPTTQASEPVPFGTFNNH